MYAVIETGGKQHRVELGSEIKVDRLDVQAGDTITLDRVLLVADGDEAAIGRPLVDGAIVSAQVLAQGRGDKVVVFKYKPKARTRVKQGFRAELTTLRITDISFGGKSAAKDAEKAAKEAAREAEAAAAAEKAAAEKAAAEKAAADKELAAKLAAAEKKSAKPARGQRAKAAEQAPAAEAEEVPAEEGSQAPEATADAPEATPGAEASAPGADTDAPEAADAAETAADVEAGTDTTQTQPDDRKDE